jgi:hypothetical protein
MSQIATPISFNMQADQIKEYNDFLDDLRPHFDSDIKEEKTATMDFRIIIMSALNETNNLTLMILHEGIRHMLECYNGELVELIEGKVEWSHAHVLRYDIVHDIASIIMQQTLYKDRIIEAREMLLSL